MPRGVLTTFQQRDLQALNREAEQLVFKSMLLGTHLQDLMLLEQTVENALAVIRNTDMEEQQRALLMEAIERLEQALGAEEDRTLLLAKYRSFTGMLQNCVINQHTSLEIRAQAMERFLTAFRAPGSNLQKKVKMGLVIGGVALLIALMIASMWVVPLIPFTAAFAFIGVTGWWLGALTTLSSLIVQVVGIYLTAWLLGKINQCVCDPLSRLFQQASDEYKSAAAVERQIRVGFFHAGVPIANSDAQSNPDVSNEQFDTVSSDPDENSSMKHIA